MTKSGALAFLCGVLALAAPARAWKPITHVYLANQALKDALDDGKVSIYVIARSAQGQALTNADGSYQLRKVGDYAVSDELKTALSSYRSNFWAGVLGPDAFPDLPTGQTVIHPPTGSVLGPDVNVGGHPDGSDAWLQYLWRKAHSPQWNTPQNLAFTFGFLCHAAGDLYAHTYINYYTGGIFDLNDNGLRHVTLEGYLLERTPRLEDSLLPDGSPAGTGSLPIYSEVAAQGLSGGVDQFIYANMMDADRNPEIWGILRGASQTKSPPWLFSKLRLRLRQTREQYAADLNDYDAQYNHEIGEANDLGRAAEACGTFDSSCSATWDRIQEGIHRATAVTIAADKAAYIALHKPVDEYNRHWIDDIDRGLAAYPNVSLKVASALMFDPSTETKWDDAATALRAFVPTLTSMAGAPDAVGSLIQFATDLMAPVDQLKQMLSDLVANTEDALLKLAFGHTKDELNQYFLGPHNRIGPVFSTGTHPPLTVGIANKDMFLADPGTDSIHPGNVAERFDWKKFAPAFNTVQLIKIALMKPEEVDRLIHDISPNSTLSLAHPDPNYPNGTPPNILLGFLRGLDAGNQFVSGINYTNSYTPGMVLARDRTVYNAVFMPVVAAEPDPLGNVVASFIPPFTATVNGGSSNNPDGFIASGDVVTLTASGAADWSLADPSSGDTLVEVPGSGGKQARLTVHTGIATTGTLTVIATERGFQKRSAPVTLTLLRDLVVTPPTADVYAGQTIKLETNVAPLAPARVVGRTSGGPRGPITLTVAPTPGVTWQTLLSGQIGTNLVRSDGTFVAPTVSQPTFYSVRAVRKDTPGTDPTTSFMGAARIRVLPALPALQIGSGENTLMAGSSRRFYVIPNAAVTWRIVGDAAGCQFGTPQSPEAATATQTLSGLQSQLTQLHSRVQAAQVAPERLRQLAPTRRFVATPVVTPALQSALQQRDDFLATNKSTLIAQTDTLERVLSTLTVPAGLIKAQAITVEATATDGSGRSVRIPIQLVPKARPEPNKPIERTEVTPPLVPVPAPTVILAPSKTGSFGKWYYYDSDKHWAYTITKAEYTAEPFVWGPKDQSFLAYPTPLEKFIKITLSVKNIGQDAREFGYQSLVGHAVSADGNNGPDFMRFKRVDNGNQALMDMPPAQSATLQTYLSLAAQGPARAITVGEATFPLGAENTVAPLPEFLSKDGTTVNEEVQAIRNQAYPGARFQATLLAINRSNANFGDVTLEDGKEFVIVTLRLKNLAMDESIVEYQTFTLTLYDSDQDKYIADRAYKENKPEQVTAPIAPNATQEDTRIVRYLFTIPKGANIKKLLLRESDARTYVYGPDQLK